MKERGRKIWRYVGITAAVLAGVLMLLSLIATIIAVVLPPAVPDAVANPAKTYEEGLARVEEIEKLDGPSIRYGTLLLTHGSRVETSVVIFYGYTNNYRQFERVAKPYYDAGCNVLVPRLPGHGEADLLTNALTEVSPEALVKTMDDSIDAAAGLGNHVEVVGLSVGGTMAMWSAYNRDEVDKMIAISPMMLPIRIPSAFVKPTTQFARVLPDFHLWWDPFKREDRKVPSYGYPRFSTKSLAAFLDLSFDVTDNPSPRTTKMAEAGLITNKADLVVDGGYAIKVFDTHIAPLAETSWVRSFERTMKLAHDIVDPGGENGPRIDEIYQQLYPMLGLPAPGTTGQ